VPLSIFDGSRTPHKTPSRLSSRDIPFALAGRFRRQNWVDVTSEGHDSDCFVNGTFKLNWVSREFHGRPTHVTGQILPLWISPGDSLRIKLPASEQNETKGRLGRLTPFPGIIHLGATSNRIKRVASRRQMARGEERVDHSRNTIYQWRFLRSLPVCRHPSSVSPIPLTVNTRSVRSSRPITLILGRCFRGLRFKFSRILHTSSERAAAFLIHYARKLTPRVILSGWKEKLQGGDGAGGKLLV